MPGRVSPKHAHKTEVGYQQGKLTVVGARFTEDEITRIPLKCECGKQWNAAWRDFVNARKGLGMISCRECAGNKAAQKARLGKSKLREVGFRQGKLTVLEVLSKPYTSRSDKSWNVTHYKVQCSCGRDPYEISHANFAQPGRDRCWTCGQRKNWRQVLPLGKRVGNLVVLRDWGDRVSVKGRTHSVALCRCDCGGTHICDYHSLGTGEGETWRCADCSSGDKGRDSSARFRSEPEWASKPTHVYLAKVNGAYLKPGIAVDPDHRADTFYDSHLFISPVLDRCDAWAIEQVLLDESSDAVDPHLPEKYEGWSGATELRLKSELPADWYINRFWELLEQCHRVGWEELIDKLDRNRFTIQLNKTSL